MAKLLNTPHLYIQGPGVLQELGKHVKLCGSRPMIIGGARGLQATLDTMKESLSKHGVELVGVEGGIKECTYPTIERLTKAGQEAGADVVISAGGGKLADTAKVVAHRMGVPAVMVPTNTSTNADASAVSVVYTEAHEFVEYVFFPTNPEVVLVDTQLLVKTPPNYLVNGMGDALACKFEGEAVKASGGKNLYGSQSTGAGLAIANLCFENLCTYGPQAKADMQKGNLTPAVDEIIESIKLLSCIGFESTGLAAAHATHNGLTRASRGIKAEHGEIVSFCTLVHMVLESRPKDQIDRVLRFTESVGLPNTLGQLGHIKPDEVKEAARYACDPSDTMSNMPVKVTPEMVEKAIRDADALGRGVKG